MRCLSLILVLVSYSSYSHAQKVTSKSTVDKTPYIGLRYAGNKLPRGHKSIGGSMITNPYGNEKQYGVEEVAKGRKKMMWLTRFTHDDAAGMPNWEITDVIFLPPMQKNQLLFYVDCRRFNKTDPELVVIADDLIRGGYYTRVRYAWRANRQTERFQPIPVTGIKCEGHGDD